MIYVLDTHPLLWFLTNHPRLSAQGRTILNDQQSRLALPATVLAEAYWIGDQGKIRGLTAASVFNAIDTDPRLNFIPLDRQIIELSLFDHHQQDTRPADRRDSA